MIADLERVSRGEPPMVALTKQLDAVAKQSGRKATPTPTSPARRCPEERRSPPGERTGPAAPRAPSDPTTAGCTTTAPAVSTRTARRPTPPAAGGTGTTSSGSGRVPRGDCPVRPAQLMMGAAHTTPAVGFGPSFTADLRRSLWRRSRPTRSTPGPGHRRRDRRQDRAADGGRYRLDRGRQGLLCRQLAGEVSAFGRRPQAGGLSAKALPAPIVAIATSNVKGGYWLVGSNGAVYPFGHAPSYGDLRSKHLAEPVVGIAVDHADGRLLARRRQRCRVQLPRPLPRRHDEKEAAGSPIVAIVADPAAAGLLADRGRWQRLPVRQRQEPRERGRASTLPRPIVAAAATKRRPRLLAGRGQRRRLPLRRRRLQGRRGGQAPARHR